MFVSVIMQFIW